MFASPADKTASPASPATKGSPRPGIEHRLNVGGPIDYSFKELKTVNDVLYEEPVSGHPSRGPIMRETDAASYLDTMTAELAESNAPPKARLNATSLRLCNNNLGSLVGLDRVMYHVLDDPSELVWLDVSCNQLACVDDVVLKYPKLQVLYMHGNQISSIHDVAKLARLEHLQKLTLHGNPIAEGKNYKMWVLARLPNLRSLDFSSITRLERDKVDTWWRAHLKQQEARNK